jgi:hypothetical protein
MNDSKFKLKTFDKSRHNSKVIFSYCRKITVQPLPLNFSEVQLSLVGGQAPKIVFILNASRRLKVASLSFKLIPKMSSHFSIR